MNNIVTIKEPLIDLRGIFFYFSNILSPFGICLNLVLLYLILYKTPKEMADYKIILLHNWLADAMFNVAVKCHTEMKDGIFFIVGSDWLKPLLPYSFNIFSIHFWVFAIFFSCTTIPAQFIYRYLIIVYSKKLTIAQYFAMLIITILGPLTVIGLWIYAELSEIDLYESKVLLLTSDYYFRGIPYFISAQIQRWPLWFCCSMGYSLAFISYGITIFTSYKVWKKLKSVYHLLSPATQQMHNQMTKTMILQAIVPLIFILFPIGVVLTTVFLLIEISGIGIICNLLTCWIPVVNPLVTILSIKCYRSTLCIRFRKPLIVPT